MEDEYINKIYLDESKYVRDNKDYTIKIDLNNKIMEYYSKNNDTSFTTDIDGYFNINEDNYYIEYKINDDIFKIIVNLL